MLLTQDSINDYKKNPAKFDYDKGYEIGCRDFNCNSKLRKFTIQDSKSFRRGYLHGYSTTKTNYIIESNPSLIDQEYPDVSYSDLYQKITEETKYVLIFKSETPSSECKEFDDNLDWSQLSKLLEV